MKGHNNEQNVPTKKINNIDEKKENKKIIILVCIRRKNIPKYLSSLDCKKITVDMLSAFLYFF